MPSSHRPVGLGTESGGACLPQGHPSQLHRATFLLSLSSPGFPAPRFPLPLPQQAGLGWPKVGAAWHPSPPTPTPTPRPSQLQGPRSNLELLLPRVSFAALKKQQDSACLFHRPKYNLTVLARSPPLREKPKHPSLGL